MTLRSRERSRHPRYGAAQTLLGGEPDINRRSIIDSWNDCEHIAVFNQEMAEWTAFRAYQLKICLDALNKDAQERDKERDKERDGGEHAQ